LLTATLPTGWPPQIQEYTDTFHYLWVFHTDNMRNKCMQEVREHWKGSRCVSSSEWPTPPASELALA
jgi:hypothetical protein